jgi:hypothetical protein
MIFYGEFWGNGGGSSLSVNLDNLIAFVVIILAHFLWFGPILPVTLCHCPGELLDI